MKGHRFQLVRTIAERFARSRQHELDVAGRRKNDGLPSIRWSLRYRGFLTSISCCQIGSHESER